MFSKLTALHALSLLLFTALAGALGCASPGQPQPPSLHLPALAERLAAQRSGNEISLTWTTPATTTDRERIKGAVTAVVCLDSAPASSPTSPAPTRKTKRRASTAIVAGSAPQPCNAVKQLPVAPGPSQVVVDLPSGNASVPPALLAYAIELQNGSGHSAGPSPPVFVAGGAAPPDVAELQISPRRQGVLVRWKPDPGKDPIELKRTLLSPLPAPKPAPKPAGSPDPFAPNSGASPAREVLLRSDAGAAPNPEPGGMIDTTALDGSTYTYVAQRVRTVTLAAHTLELRSAPSAAITFTYRDTFPPPAPAGLVLVPGGGFGEAPSIDLAWDASFADDLAGYNVYRREAAGDFIKLTPEPIREPAFRDLNVQPGRRYTYRVTAVDQRHNESAPGSEAAETLRR